MTTEEISQEALSYYAELGESILTAMHKELTKAGIEQTMLPANAFRQASFSLKQDPFSQQDTLEGIWRDERGHKKGEILFHADGSFYAEYDVVQPHPKKQQWFIESVTAWGRDQSIKTDVKLLPAC